MAAMNSYNHNVVKFNEQKTSWENAIHLYKGPDPLEYWFHYVNWYEQNYCYDATNKMPELLQKILSQFNNINAYKQDHRMVKVWLKYVELQPNPLNHFQNLYQRGVGTQLSFFYIAWANCYLKENDFKLAESAINWGFQAQAKPLEDLQSAQQQVANSYYEYTQRQRPGPYQIVVQQQPTNHQQPPLPAQVATNYQNPSYVRDKRKLEDTFPVHGANHHHQHQQQAGHGGGQPAKRSRPNEDYNAHYAATGYHSPVPNHYNQAAASPKPVTYHNNYPPQQQQQHYVQHPEMAPGHPHLENGKSPHGHHPHQQHTPSPVYQQQHHQDPYHSPVYAQHQAPPQQQHQNGQQYHHPVAQQHQAVYQPPYPVSSISNNSNSSSNQYTEAANHNNGHQQQQQHQTPQVVNGYSDLNNDGFGIASSLNYVYEDYHQAGAVGGEVILEEEVVLEQPQQQVTEVEKGIQVPENFARAATNSHNIWRAPLYLEEPYNVNQRPMYIKDQVYPILGAEQSGRCEYEYSFEELRANARKLAAQTKAQEDAMPVVEGEVDTYEEYWTEEVTVQADDFNQGQQGQVLSGRLVSDNTYGEYVQDQGHENGGGGVYYHVMEPKTGSAYGEVVVRDRKSSKSSKKKSKQKKKNLIVQINDTEEDEEEDDEAEEDNGQGDQETTTIRYTCDQNGLGGDGQGGGGSGDVRRITIKLRKQPNTPTSTSATSTPKVPYGSGRNGGSNGTGFYRRTATDADADLLLSLGNGQSGFYQEMKPNTYNEDSSSYSEYNASYNSSYIGDNSNSGFTSAPPTEPSTPIHSFQHSRLASISATSTPQLTPAYRRLTKHRSNVSLMNDDSMSSSMNENSFFQGELDEEVKSRRMAKAVATVDEHLAKKSIDPFNAELCKALLTKIGFPSAELCDVYRMVQTPLPKLSNAKQALLGDTYYNVEKEVGRGTYGAVYKATNVYSGATVAIKFQKPANSWELYICNEIKKRIKYHDILPGFMDITSAVLAPNGCVLISEFSPYGSLLDINNKIRQATTRVMHESLVMHFASQILDIVHYLHECKIVHADIKPDNFLIMKAPNSSSHVPTVRLIDFGCAIDMNLFPENTQFKKVIQTEGFTCTEMKENRPWTYQTDLYCIAATVHVMLFGEYMQVSKKFDGWEIKQKLPRYLKKNVWMDFFNKLLNIPDCDELPNLQELKAAIDNEVYAMESELQKHIRTLTNLLFKR